MLQSYITVHLFQRVQTTRILYITQMDTCLANYSPNVMLLMLNQINLLGILHIYYTSDTVSCNNSRDIKYTPSQNFYWE